MISARDEKPMRLDIALVERALVPTRARARDLVRRGLVHVEGRIETRPARLVRAADDIGVSQHHARLVSRSAAKLEHALATFRFDASRRVALDAGASTGGFTQTLLAAGATKVYAVDIGHGQLDASLAGDTRIVNLERRDVRSLTPSDFREPLGAITVDLSFISLRHILPALMALAAPGAWLIALIKPQFEVGPRGLGKGGVVRDAAERERALAQVSAAAKRPGWRFHDALPSPLPGKDGNLEYLLGAEFSEDAGIAGAPREQA